jgi:uncharacterized membrane protein YhhN
MSDTVPLIAFLVFATSNWAAVVREDTALNYLTKPAALVALLIYAAMGDAPSAWLIAALALSLLGDVYLMLPTDAFAAGLAAFLLAHVAYIADLDGSLAARAVWWIVIGGVTAPLWLRIVRGAPAGATRTAVASYIAVIGLMVASALASGSRIAIVGALLFVSSDTILGWNRFVQPLTWARAALIVTYHLGQFGLVYALRG